MRTEKKKEEKKRKKGNHNQTFKMIRSTINITTKFYPSVSSCKLRSKRNQRSNYSFKVYSLKSSSKKYEIVDRRHLLQEGIILTSFLVGNDSFAKQGSSSAYTPESDKIILMNSTEAEEKLSKVQKLILEQNKRVQSQNNVPNEFPSFVRQGFDVIVIGDGFIMEDSGIIYKDFVMGEGNTPADGQQVIFDYQSFNESAKLIDTTYRFIAQSRKFIIGS
eukprot:TRINITY_DN52138_c0_g1_i1.p2 TRINITY_DN52138_c0_g1~~TRINITY_DN52138_c0_g1_i1.p2  ORF type:complete len:219 (-),score=17.36 TRINITY_DN52138_c0_g1_i1:10-666(-)